MLDKLLGISEPNPPGKRLYKNDAIIFGDIKYYHSGEIFIPSRKEQSRDQPDLDRSTYIGHSSIEFSARKQRVPDLLEVF